MRRWLLGADAVMRALVAGLGTALTRLDADPDRDGRQGSGRLPPREDPRRH